MGTSQAQAPIQESTFFWSTGNDFLRICDDTSPVVELKGACSAYVVGVIDGIRYLWSVEISDKPSARRLMCTDAGVTVGQEKLVLIQYIKTHPASAHWPTASLTFLAMVDAFPCPAETTRQ